MAYIGSSVQRKEDNRLLTGAGRYVADFNLPGALHATIIRSPHAHAELGGIDASAALAIPGVFAVITWDDIAAIAKPIPMRLDAMSAMAPALQYPLAHTRVRYVGEPVAVVLAASRYIAEDAADLVSVDYRPLGVVADVDTARTPGAPRLFDEFPENVATKFVKGRDPGDAFDQAAVVVRGRFSTNRHMACPMETRGLLANYEAETDKITVWGPTKVIHWNRTLLASMLEHPEEHIRFIEPDVGGAFGLRGEFFPEDFLIPYCAKRFGRPVKWVEDRREHLMAGAHSRQQTYEVEMAATAEGTIVGARLRLYQDLGSYVRTNGPVPPSISAALFSGPYRFPSLCEVYCVLTNKTPAGTYRAPGRFESNFVRERLLDMVASELGLDPAEIRRRNLIRVAELPFATGTSLLGHEVVFDSGDYGEIMEKALEEAGYAAFRQQQTHAADAREAVGIGLGCFIEKTGAGTWEYSRIKLGSDGQVILYTGSASCGQGIETILAQIVAETLGTGYETVTVRHGDTDEIAMGTGAWASRATIHAGNCAREVSLQLRNRIVELAAARLEAAPEDLEIAGGRAFVRGAAHRGCSFAEIAAEAGSAGILAEFVNEQHHIAYSMGTHVAKVAVNLETGQVRVLEYHISVDVGRAVNPLLVRGQIIGGLAQGLGGALMEDLVYDSAGQLLAGSLMDYLLPTACEVPPVGVSIMEYPTPHNKLGVKGAGEGGTTAAGAAIANAIVDALRTAGIRVCITDLPLSPERVWQLAAAGGGRLR